MSKSLRKFFNTISDIFIIAFYEISMKIIEGYDKIKPHLPKNKKFRWVAMILVLVLLLPFPLAFKLGFIIGLLPLLFIW
jgi:hypothetical protein